MGTDNGVVWQDGRAYTYAYLERVPDLLMLTEIHFPPVVKNEKFQKMLHDEGGLYEG